ncbi:MAG: oxidoreductase [Bacteroidota bacterium]|jgi:predicted DsbA family dithiol-disulfide isomerase|nr:oxidoreductase [Bacteroidota bacterium]
MKVEIWSDIMCPFCYIGKRKFEEALKQFDGNVNVELEWKSFQLNPEMKTEPGKSINQYLAEIKGWSLPDAKAMNDRVTQMAKAVGLEYDMDKAVVANSFDAHRVIQFAKKKGKGDLAEENLFKAYFTEGKNIADKSVLFEIGNAIGLPKDELKDVLESDEYSKEVNFDMEEAGKIGVSGVPFFVFNRRYAVSGAQDPEVFLDVLNKVSKDEKSI